MFNFRKFISVSAIAMLGATNLLTPLSYANAADVGNYDTAGNPIWTGKSFSFIMPAHDVFLYAITEANTYTVDYEGHGETSGTMSGKVFTYDSEDVLDLNAFNKTGYTFTQWTTEEDGGGSGFANGQEVLNLTSVDNAHVPIYAQWGANSYSIDYDLNDDGSTSKASHPKTPTGLSYDETGTIENPTRTGYTFTGWYVTGMDSELHLVAGEEVSTETANAGTGTQFKNLRATSGTVHLAARWKADEVNYTINHFLQELDGNYPDNPSFTNTGTWTADTDMTGATNTYTGFTTPSEYSENIEPDGTTTFRYNYERKSYNLELIAGRGVDTVTVESTSYSSGGTNSGTETYSFKFDDHVALHFALKPGYTGGVWSGYSGTASNINMPAENISKTAYADVITYTITQDCQGGSGCVESQEYNVESAPIPLPTPTGTHSDFLGWIGTDIDGRVKTYEIPTGSTGDKAYTAQWQCHTGYHASNSADTGDINYGNCIANTDTPFTIEYYEETLTGDYVLTNTGSDHGKTDTNTAVDPADREGFTTKEVEQQNINGDGSTVVQVKYDRNSYSEDIQDGTGLHTTAVGANDAGASGSGHHQYGDTITLSYTEEPGYTFDHWVVEGSGFGPITLNSGNNTFTMPASDVTITSVSTTNTYHISIDKNGGVGGTDSGYEYTVESSVTLENPTRLHSVFVGWSGTDLNQTTETVTFSGRAYDSSYEAVWDCDTGYTANPDGQSCDANVYTVTINYNDEDQDNVTTGYVYDQTGTIEIPSKSGYDFAGWTVSGTSETATADGQPLENPTSGTEFNNLTTTSGGTVTFEANWVAKDDTEYKVFYYTQNVENDNYTLVDSGVHNGTSDTQVAVSSLVYDISGYNTPAVGYLDGGIGGHSGESYTLITIDRHGTTEIYLFYDRGTFNVYLSGDAHVTALSGAGEYKFGDTVNVSAEVATGYHFKQWIKKANSGFVTDL